MKVNSIHHVSMEIHIDIYASLISTQKFEDKTIKLRNSSKYFDRNLLLYILGEDTKEALFESCDNLLNKVEIVTQQFKIIQDKFTYIKIMDDNSSTSTKPWTKSKKFINLIRKRKNLQKSLLNSKENDRYKIKLDLKVVIIDITKIISIKTSGIL